MGCWNFRPWVRLLRSRHFRISMTDSLHLKKTHNKLYCVTVPIEHITSWEFVACVAQEIISPCLPSGCFLYVLKKLTVIVFEKSWRFSGICNPNCTISENYQKRVFEINDLDFFSIHQRLPDRPGFHPGKQDRIDSRWICDNNQAKNQERANGWKLEHCRCKNRNVFFFQVTIRTKHVLCCLTILKVRPHILDNFAVNSYFCLLLTVLTYKVLHV